MSNITLPLAIGGRYNWKSQPERLIYKGHNFSGNGYWHQFAEVDNPGVVWCEVLTADLRMFEETKEDEMNAADVLTAILHARDKGEDPAMILDENSPLMDAAREALKPRAPLDAAECARSLLTLADWSGAPRKTEWGAGMFVADVMLTKDETMTVYVHGDVLKEYRKP